MSSSAKKPSSAVGKAGSSPKRRSKSPTKPESPGKGKGKVSGSPRRKGDHMDEDMDDEEEDNDDEDDDEDEDDEEDEEDAMEEDDDEDDEDDDEDDEDDNDGDERINPSAILPRRTRGARVDYTSTKALEKAGLNPEDQDDDDAT